MKKVLVLVLAAMLALSLVACTTSAPAPQTEAAAPAEEAAPAEAAAETTEAAAPAGTGEAFDDFPHPAVVANDQIKVGLLHSPLSYEYNIRVVAQCKLECAYRGWEFVDGLYEEEAAARDVWKTLINSGCNVIILMALDNTDAYADLVAESRNKGIGVYCSDNTITTGIISNVTMPGGVAALEMAYYLGNEYGWNAKNCILCADGNRNHAERARSYYGFTQGIYTDFTTLAYSDVGGVAESMQNSYDYTQAWLQQYGDDIDIIFGSCDAFAMSAAEAIKANGDTKGEKTITVGIDGGNDSWSVLREGGPFKLSYAQPGELFMHTTLEIAKQIQVDGLKPGDDGCTLAKVGQTIFCSGSIVTMDNLPDQGQPIHAAFDYYTEPDNPEAWYNWCPDGFEIYSIE